MDRRRERRIPVQELIEARMVGEGVDTVGRVIDLNNAGAFIATEVPLTKDTRLEIELRLPGQDKTLPLQAVVARRSEAILGRSGTIPAGVGIVFLPANVMERSFIQMAVLGALKTSIGSPHEGARPGQAAGASDSSNLAENSSR